MSALVLYTDYDYCLYESLLETYTAVLPQTIIHQAMQYRRWQDRQASIIGKLLIWKGLKKYGYEDDCLTKLQVNNYGKPFIDQRVFFNLSHAGRYVICAFYREEIGIDIEEITAIHIDDFTAIFSEEEKYQLGTNNHSLQSFFSVWTIKESVIKAEGKGLSIPMNRLDTSKAGTVLCGKKIWYVEEIHNFSNYACAVATPSRLSSILVRRVNFENAQLQEAAIPM